MAARVIPVLTFQGKRLVKTVRFKKPNYIGDPINAIKIFNDKEVDEIAVLDIDANKTGGEPDYQLIEEMASECFSPLAYGGGIQTFEQVQRIMNLGVEKVILNSVLLKNKKLISDSAAHIGEQSVVASVDYKYSLFGKRKVVFNGGVKSFGVDLLDWLRELESLGVGELILHNVDREGTFKGYDLDTIAEVSSKVGVPIIALGGAKNLGDMKEAITSGASAVAAASMFVYQKSNPESILINYPSQERLHREIFLSLP